MEPYRKFTLATFRRFGIGTSGFEEAIAKESTNLIEELAKVKDNPVELTWYLNIAVANIICKVVFGIRYELSEGKIQRLTDLVVRLTELAGAGGLELNVPIDIPSESKRQLTKVIDELHQFIEEMIETHRENFDENNLNDFVDVWLNEIRLHGGNRDDESSYLNSKNMRGLTSYVFLRLSSSVESS